MAAVSYTHLDVYKRQLADRVGIELPKQEMTSAQRREADRRTQLLEHRLGLFLLAFCDWIVIEVCEHEFTQILHCQMCIRDRYRYIY